MGEPSVEERVVHCLAVRKQNHSKESAFHLGNCSSPADSTIMLDDFPNRRANGLFNPSVLNRGLIGALSDRLEVSRRLHSETLPDRRQASKACHSVVERRSLLPRTTGPSDYFAGIPVNPCSGVPWRATRADGAVGNHGLRYEGNGPNQQVQVNFERAGQKWLMYAFAKLEAV